MSESITECPKLYRKSVLPLPNYRFAVCLSSCSTYLRLILGHSVAEDREKNWIPELPHKVRGSRNPMIYIFFIKNRKRIKRIGIKAYKLVKIIQMSWELSRWRWWLPIFLSEHSSMGDMVIILDGNSENDRK